MRARILTFLVAILASFPCLQCSRSGSEVAVGSTAPNFSLTDLRGKEISLAQYQGKVVILDFWATWCGPCRMSMPMLEKIQKEYPSDVKLLAVNLQDPIDDVKDFVARQNFNSTVLLDSEGRVGSVYQAGSIPMQVVIDKKGIVSSVHVGFSPRMGEQLRGEIEKLRSN